MSHIPLLSTSASSCPSYSITITPHHHFSPYPHPSPYIFLFLSTFSPTSHITIQYNTIQFISADGPVLACESLLLSCVLCALSIDRVAASGAFEFIINLSRTFSGVRIRSEILLSLTIYLYMFSAILLFFLPLSLRQILSDKHTFSLSLTLSLSHSLTQSLTHSLTHTHSFLRFLQHQSTHTLSMSYSLFPYSCSIAI
jgi:hypothetical protein